MQDKMDVAEEDAPKDFEKFDSGTLAFRGVCLGHSLFSPPQRIRSCSNLDDLTYLAFSPDQINPGEIVRIDAAGVKTMATVERTSRRAGRGRMEMADSCGGEVVRSH